MSTELKENLRRIVADVSEVDAIPDDTDFRELGIDSMMGIEIVAEIERTYKISVPESELKNMTSLTRVYELVQANLAASTAAS
jgi:acyl carrier protein